MTSDPRYTRQLLLAEFQSGGQEKLEASTFTLPAALGRDVTSVATAYARRAGVGLVEILDEDSAAATAAGGPGLAEFGHSEHFRHAASRNVAMGSHSALGHLRHILGRQ